MNLTDYKGIVVFAEQRDGQLENVGIELIGEAKRLAENLETKEVTAVLIGSEVKDLSKELIAYGADRVVLVDKPELKYYDTETYTQALKAIVDAKLPEIILVGATTIGRDLGPRMSARLATGLTADCTQLEIYDEVNKATGETVKGLGMTRPAFGGNLMATIISPDNRPQMSTVRPGVMKKLAKDETRSGVVEEFDVALDMSKVKVKVLEIVKEEKVGTDITEAKILVSGGRGISNAENFALLKDFADEIGAEVSSSRAMVDAGIMHHDKQVGQTGKTVRPEIYFAMGISGAIQHVAGMEESEFIIAINKDKYAPIFEVADLGIVGDAVKITAMLAEEVKKAKSAAK